jgi:hypothetical protein
MYRIIIALLQMADAVLMLQVRWMFATRGDSETWKGREDSPDRGALCRDVTGAVCHHTAR